MIYGLILLLGQPTILQTFTEGQTGMEYKLGWRENIDGFSSIHSYTK